MPMLKVNVGSKENKIWQTIDASNSEMVGGATHDDIINEMHDVTMLYTGFLGDLTTGKKETLTDALNEVVTQQKNNISSIEANGISIQTNAANISSLQQDLAQTNNHVGVLPNLSTDSKTNLVTAINEVNQTADTINATIGSVSDLSTENNTTLVSAINEVDKSINTINNNIGDMSSLLTDDKDSLIKAINEVKASADSAFQSASDGKKLIADALTGKGISASPSDTYDTLSSKISSVKNQLAVIFTYDSTSEVISISFVDLAGNVLEIEPSTTQISGNHIEKVYNSSTGTFENSETMVSIPATVSNETITTDDNSYIRSGDYVFTFDSSIGVYNGSPIPAFNIQVTLSQLNTRIVKMIY